MRAVLRQIIDAVSRLDAYAKGLSARVQAIEAAETPERVIERTVEVRIESSGDSPPVTITADEVAATVEERVKAFVAEQVAAVILPEAAPPAEIDYTALQSEVTAWLDGQRETLKGADAQPVDYDAISAALEEWLTANLPRYIPAPIKGDNGDKGDPGEPGPQGDKGDPGKDAPRISAEIVGNDLLVTIGSQVKNVGRVVGRDGEVKTIIETRTIPGLPGENGAGIADITQDGQTLIITLTDGRDFRFKLPAARGAGVMMGSGVSEARVLELIAQNPSGAAPNTGWAQYLDTQYTALSPFVTLDGATNTLPNNAGNNIVAYLPEGVAKLYDPVAQKLTPADVGDYNAITIRFTAETSATSTYLEFGIDTGSPLGPIFRDIKVFPKGAGVEHPFTFTCLGFSLNNFFGNGGIVKITAVGGDVEIYDINYHFARLIPAS